MVTTLALSIEGSTALLRAFSVTVTEAISTLSAVDVACTGPVSSLLGVTLIGQAASLVVSTDTGAVRTFRGIVGRIEIMPPTAYDEAFYRIRLVPLLSRLLQSRHNRVFGTQTPVAVTDLIAAQLSGAMPEGDLAAETASQPIAHELRVRQTYPVYNQVVQREETSFAFLSRQAEHWGLFYFFEDSGEQEQVVFADDNVFVAPLPGGKDLRWQPWIAGEHVSVPDCIFMLQAAYDPVPQTVYLRDYNELLPHVSLLVSQEVDARAAGNWVEYGANYRTPEEGALLAAIRAQEWQCRRVRFSGRSTAVQLAPGFMFALSGHPYSAWNQEYMIVSVKHRANQAHPSFAADASSPAYVNEFTAIPLSVPFRPERVTPRPRSDGVLNGRTETTMPLAWPDLDPNGYYRVRLPVDMSDSASGTASQWIRKAEPYGGPANGMHFPLPAGTDVVVACLNGDPDRPIIVGAVPSADNPSVVDSVNPRMNRIRTRSGVQLTMMDAPTQLGGMTVALADGTDTYTA